MKWKLLERPMLAWRSSIRACAASVSPQKNFWTSFQEAQGAVKWVKQSGLKPIQLTCCSTEILVAVRGASRHVWGIWVNFHPVLKPSSEDVVLIERSWKISTWLCYPCWTRTAGEKPDFSIHCLSCCVGVGLAEMAGVWHTRWDWQRRGSAFS